MAVITRISATGSSLNTPWDEITPLESGGTLIQRVAWGAGYRPSSNGRYLGQIEASPGAITLNTGNTNAVVHMFCAREGGVNSNTYSFTFGISSTFMDEDEAAQDAALSTNLSVNIGGVNYCLCRIGHEYRL